jgi:hypothetical protein
VSAISEPSKSRSSIRIRSRAPGVAFDPPGRRVEGADKALGQDCLDIFQRGVAYQVEQFGHAGLAQLDQGRFGRVRPDVFKRGGLDSNAVSEVEKA